ncbi:MAG: S8 family serine peptidase [Candidatus Zixiibacteriota bacterium]
MPLFALGVTEARSEELRGPVPGRFIVKLSPHTKAAVLQQAAATEGSLTAISQLRLRDDLRGAEFWDRYYIFTATKSDATLAAAALAIGQNNIEWIEQDYYLEFFDFPTDPLFTNQWYLRNTGQEYLGIDRREGNGNDSLVLKRGVADKDMRVSAFYQTPPIETTRVVVAIVDTGTDPDHPELAGRYWKNPDEIPSNGIDDDHNGFVDDTLGYDVSGDIPSLFNIVGDNDPTDIVGHGTHIAGIVAANADGNGVVGVAPWAEIMSVKIRPNATNAVGAAGIMYAVNAGAQVINISWGTPFEALILKDALDFARRNGVFVAIAAGNTGRQDTFYPAAFDSAFAVAAGNSSGFVASFSTFGPQIDITAPGLDILSLRAAGTDMYADAGEPGVRIIGPDSLYYLADGTSMAAPVVAGAAAFLLGVRPDLNLDQLEDLLRMGASDLVDPLDKNDTLPGPDSVSGYGYINVAQSYGLLQHGGLTFAQPTRMSRYTGAVPIVVRPVASYSGPWWLAYAVPCDPNNWLPIDSGLLFPSDSLTWNFDQPAINGDVTLRLLDEFGTSITTRFTYVNSRGLELTSPAPAEELRYNVMIRGSAYGPHFDSMLLSFQSAGKQPIQLLRSSAEFFDTLIYTWNISGVDTGDATILLTGHFDGTVVTDSIPVRISSTYAAGWPQALAGRGSQTPVCGDIDGDGQKEIIVGTSSGLYAFHANGVVVDGFPLMPDKDMRCVPAIFDVDGDGSNDIITTNEDGIHVFRHDGTEALGWPKNCTTGLLAFGYPNPTVTNLTPNEPPAIAIVNEGGQLLAYELNGDSYFYSLRGFYSSINPGWTPAYRYGGNLVTTTDLNGDNLREAVASFSGILPSSGTAVFDGRTGQPAFDLPSPLVINATVVYGTALADLTGDSLPEIVSCGYDATNARVIWAKTQGLFDLPGFPIRLPEMSGWRGNFPTLADLDLDGIPEILCTFFEFDIGTLYIFRVDGTPYIERAGRPVGEAFRYSMTFGVPMVANLAGDQYPEIVFRGGYILPGTGTEKLFLLDYQANLLPGWPITTAAPNNLVISSPYAPLVDDIDGDGFVEMALTGDANQIFVWNLETSYDNGRNSARLLGDNRNSAILPGAAVPTDAPAEGGTLPTTLTLRQNYPNPFNPSTTISFALPQRGKIRLTVFNLLGQQVATLVDNELPPGEHRVQFDGSAYASGLYLYRLVTDNGTVAKKMLLIK